ncbi:MAG TPA: hypothetical protein VFE33_06790 [Thermoanaerobaculia bacterium]|nr:hypothetical protein [Thermoanaerobaculia bacterium]
MWKKVLLLLGLAVLGVASFLVFQIGPRNIIGLLRYDQRHEGRLRVGDPAPDVAVTALDGTSRQLLAGSRGRPVVLVFGSYT